VWAILATLVERGLDSTSGYGTVDGCRLIARIAQ